MEERTQENCVWRDHMNKYAVGCRRLITSEDCGPNCKWHQTTEDVQASREKARQNFIKMHGYDGYEKNESRHGARARHYITTLAIVALSILIPVSSKADEIVPEPTPEPEIIFFELVPEVTPTPVPMPVCVHSYKHDAADVERLARLLWSSPLRSEDAKEALLWVVLNRVDDRSGLFDNDIESVVSKHEFAFFDKRAHLSDANMRIAREVLDAWKSEKDGMYVGRHVPKNGLYIRFVGLDNRGIEVTAERGGSALTW